MTYRRPVTIPAALFDAVVAALAHADEQHPALPDDESRPFADDLAHAHAWANAVRDHGESLGYDRDEFYDAASIVIVANSN